MSSPSESRAFERTTGVPDVRAALRVLAETAPLGSGVTVTVPRETLLDLLHVHAPCLLPAAAPTPDRLLKVEEAAQLAGVSPRWLYRHARGQPFAHKLGGRTLRISESGLRRWIERQKGQG